MTDPRLVIGHVTLALARYRKTMAASHLPVPAEVELISAA